MIPSMFSKLPHPPKIVKKKKKRKENAYGLCSLQHSQKEVVPIWGSQSSSLASMNHN
jgi:hypothetical protein